MAEAVKWTEQLEQSCCVWFVISEDLAGALDSVFRSLQEFYEDVPTPIFVLVQRRSWRQGIDQRCYIVYICHGQSLFIKRMSLKLHNLFVAKLACLAQFRFQKRLHSHHTVAR